MKKSFWLILITATIFMELSCSKDSGQVTVPAAMGKDSLTILVEELDSLIYPLSGASPELNDNDLQVLSLLGDAKIVGLGEATHGTKEFFQLKHRIFKYLVENYGFKIFAFETDMGESVYIDRYINTGQGNLEETMKGKMVYAWVWKTEETKELIEWMRLYNKGKTESERLHFVGVDCQTMRYQQTLIEEYFQKHKPEFMTEIAEYWSKVKQIDPQNPTEFYRTAGKDKIDEITAYVNLIVIKIDEIQSELIHKSGNYEFQMIRQIVINIQQANEKYTSNMYRPHDYIRDYYMAENVLWLSDLFNGKTVVWAHNGHVQKEPIGQMGFFIKHNLGNNYKSLGFTFSNGSFIANNIEDGKSIGKREVHNLDSAPLNGSINLLNNKAKYENFILKCSDIKGGSEFGKWLSLPRKMLNVGFAFNINSLDNFYGNVILKDYYDVIIHYDVTTPSVLLKGL